MMSHHTSRRSSDLLTLWREFCVSELSLFYPPPPGLLFTSCTSSSLDCELVALLEDDTGMELLVCNKIISLDLPVKEVYKKIWCAQQNVRKRSTAVT